MVGGARESATPTARRSPGATRGGSTGSPTPARSPPVACCHTTRADPAHITSDGAVALDGGCCTNGGVVRDPAIGRADGKSGDHTDCGQPDLQRPLHLFDGTKRLLTQRLVLLQRDVDPLVDPVTHRPIRTNSRPARRARAAGHTVTPIRGTPSEPATRGQGTRPPRRGPQKRSDGPALVAASADPPLQAPDRTVSALRLALRARLRAAHPSPEQCVLSTGAHN
jgi:hypothetical protein